MAPLSRVTALSPLIRLGYSPRMRSKRSHFDLLSDAFFGLSFLLLVACGGSSDTSQPEEPTPPSTPEPTPAPLEDVRLYHLRLDEHLDATHLPTLSPLNGVGVDVPLPQGFVTAAAVKAAGGSPEVVESMLQLEQGNGPSGGSVAILEWNLRWGDSAGHARYWGVCSLPCTVESEFVATREHYPVDPVLHPLPLFAHRPGYAALEITERPAGLSVRQGEEQLWNGEDSSEASWEEELSILWLSADLSEVEERSTKSQRKLRVSSVSDSTVTLRESGAAPPVTISMLPPLPKKTAAAKTRAVEGVSESWPWPEAARFEGGFVARPNPADFGLRLDRIGQQILWTPTLSQAVAGQAEFVTHELMRTGGVKTTVSPFPRGTEVLGAVPLLEGAVVLASGKAGYEEQPRAQEIKRLLLRFEDHIPLPAREPEAASSIIYISDHAAGLVDGSAGSSDHSFVVSSEPGEELSVARAWSRLALGAHSGVRSPAADDMALWIEGELLRGLHGFKVSNKTDSGESIPAVQGLFAPVFAEAGEDILAEWKFRVRGEKFKGSPDISEFLGFIGEQLPELEQEVRRKIALRSIRSVWENSALPASGDNVAADLSLKAVGGELFVTDLPGLKEPSSWTVQVTPKTEGWVPRWSWASFSTGAWAARLDSEKDAETTLELLSPTVTKPAEVSVAASVQPVLRPPPSQLKAATEAPVVAAKSPAEVAADAGPRMALSSEVLLERDWSTEEEHLLVVVVWAEDNSSTELGEFSIAVRANYPPAEPEPESDPETDSGVPPAGAVEGEGRAQQPTPEEGTSPSPTPSKEPTNSVPTEG
jgi:hypothetical protein